MSMRICCHRVGFFRTLENVLRRHRCCLMIPLRLHVVCAVGTTKDAYRALRPVLYDCRFDVDINLGFTLCSFVAMSTRRLWRRSASVGTVVVVCQVRSPRQSIAPVRSWLI